MLCECCCCDELDKLIIIYKSKLGATFLHLVDINFVKNAGTDT